VKCSLCGREFNEKEAERGCKSCPIMKGCKLVKCPNCGFETPLEPKWLKYFNPALPKEEAGNGRKSWVKKERESNEDKR